MLTSTFLAFSVWDWPDSRLKANFEDARPMASNSWTAEHVSMHYFVLIKSISRYRVALFSMDTLGMHAVFFCIFICGVHDTICITEHVEIPSYNRIRIVVILSTWK